MVILGMESSAQSASAAVIKDGKLLSEMFLNVGLTHSATLMPLIKSAVKESGIGLSEIEAVAVSNGPGSFTGVRIGVATAKGIAQPSNKKCVPVSTLEAIAYPLSSSGCIAAAVMDARCSQVYSAFFDCTDSFKRISEDDAFSLDILCKKINNFEKTVVLIGDGADIAYEYLKDKCSHIKKANPLIKYQNASSVAFVAEEYIKNNQNICSYAELVPSYLRLPQAERELKLKKGEKLP